MCCEIVHLVSVMYDNTGYDPLYDALFLEGHTPLGAISDTAVSVIYFVYDYMNIIHTYTEVFRCCSRTGNT